MRSLPAFRHYFGVSFLITLFLLCGFGTAIAQDAPADRPPPFSAQDIEARLTGVSSNSDLSTDQQTQIKAALEITKDRLAEATRQAERSAQYAASVKNAAETRAELDAELQAAEQALKADGAPLKEMIGDDALLALEQELFEKESILAQVENRLSGLQETLNNLTLRQTAAPQELAEARAALVNLQSRLNELGRGELEPVSNARRSEAQARIWYRRNQIRTLEQEIETLPKRQELLLGRRAVADIRAQILQIDVAGLSARTGQKRVNEAREQRNRIAADMQAADIRHPLVQTYAQTNIGLADKIADIAAEAPIISQATASAKGRVIDVENDLNAAQNLVEQGRLDREAGDTLRRLGAQLQKPKSIRVDIRDAQNKRVEATRDRIIAQEDLRDLPNGLVDLNSLVVEARRDDSNLPDLSSLEEEILSSIIDTRRDLLRQITTLSNTKINSVSELQSAQASLLTKTESLQNLLDENLIWVRSVPAIGTSFPQKVILGTMTLFSPQNFSLAMTELIRIARIYTLLVLGFIIMILLMYRARPNVRAEVQRRAEFVGRVKQDSVWHTITVIAAGIFNSLPLALMFLLIGLLYKTSDRPERLIQGLANGAIHLSLFSIVAGAWIRWDRENGLFDAHFNVPDGLRQAIGVNLRWFLPVMGTFSVFLAITYGMKDKNIAEGFSVFVFILTSLSLVVFASRILWAKHAELYAADQTESLFMRFRTPIAVIVIGMPLVMIGLAMTGYYESANELNLRMFLTGPLVLVTYVVHGAIRRAIVVAKRQLKYREALEKREADLEARRQKEAAEERGEEVPPPPPIDTETIDVTTITRQTSKLLQTLVLLAFAGLLWMIWSSLVPALSIFDGFSVWTIEDAGRDADGLPISRIISLWDLLQALAILALTFFSARNLPGFLEIFVLSRMGVDAGTRYAITTVMGYVIIGAGVIIGFEQLGLQWSQLKWIATGLSVGIGFGLQKIIANFISGLIILFERPIRIGDYVTIGDQSGTVSRIKIRATTLKDLDNLEILIPNEALISERVTNWTLSSSITRLIVPVGIAYGSDTDEAREIMLDSVRDLPKVLTTPSPNVLFMGFGESSLDFEVRVYLSTFDDRVPMTHVVLTEVNKALEQAGISVPFPQRDLNIVSQTSPLEIKAEKLPARKKATGPKSSPKTSKS